MIQKYFLPLFLLVNLSLFAQDKSIFDIARKGTITEVKDAYTRNPESINTLNEDGYSALILACYRGNVDVALFLIEKANNLNYISGDGTALMAAIMSGNTKIIDSLIDHKADLNLSDAQGKTALIYATFFNKTEIAKKLLKAGANKTLKDSDGKSALDFANANKNTELIILLDQ